MKRISLAVLAALGMIGSAPGHAQNFAEVAVATSATVPLQVCRFATNSAALTLGHGGGDIDPLSLANATGQSVVNYACGAGVALEFTCVSGTNSPCDGSTWGPTASGVFLLSRAGGGSMAANASIAGAGPGQGYATPLPATISGSIVPGQFSAAIAGTYAGSVTFGIRSPQ
jgi:hypothetical protein